MIPWSTLIMIEAPVIVVVVSIIWYVRKHPKL